MCIAVMLPHSPHLWNNQIVDSGLDESVCFFADENGQSVEHGHLFDGKRMDDNGTFITVGGNPSFTYDLSRRKVTWPMDMLKYSRKKRVDLAHQNSR